MAERGVRWQGGEAGGRRGGEVVGRPGTDAWHWRGEVVVWFCCVRVPACLTLYPALLSRLALVSPPKPLPTTMTSTPPSLHVVSFLAVPPTLRMAGSISLRAGTLLCRALTTMRMRRRRMGRAHMVATMRAPMASSEDEMDNIGRWKKCLCGGGRS